MEKILFEKTGKVFKDVSLEAPYRKFLESDFWNIRRRGILYIPTKIGLLAFIAVLIAIFIALLFSSGGVTKNLPVFIVVLFFIAITVLIHFMGVNFGHKFFGCIKISDVGPAYIIDLINTRWPVVERTAIPKKDNPFYKIQPFTEIVFIDFGQDTLVVVSKPMRIRWGSFLPGVLGTWRYRRVLIGSLILSANDAKELEKFLLSLPEAMQGDCLHLLKELNVDVVDILTGSPKAAMEKPKIIINRMASEEAERLGEIV